MLANTPLAFIWDLASCVASAPWSSSVYSSSDSSQSAKRYVIEPKSEARSVKPSQEQTSNQGRFKGTFIKKMDGLIVLIATLFLIHK